MQRVIPILAALALLHGAQNAQAIPILQLYLEGGAYDQEEETWTLVLGPSDEAFRIWAIGNVDGPGGKGAIEAVRMAMAYSSDFHDLGITLTPSLVGGVNVATYNGIGQQNPGDIPQDPAFLQLVTDGSVPELSDGSDLPSHGIYGEGVFWQEFLLGDLTNSHTKIGDFIDEFPSELHEGGHINVYEVSVTNGVGATIHFDLYNSIQMPNPGPKAVFAPFSHNASSDQNGGNGSEDDENGFSVPEPSALAIWLLIGVCCGTAGLWRRRVQSQRPS